MEGYCLREVNFIGEELGIESVVNSAFRLFRNRPAYRYDGALHEQIMGTVDPEGGRCTAFVGIEIHHYGYLEPTSRAKEKTDRNMAIVMEEVARKPKDSFTLFNAGVEYQRVGRHEEALDYFQRSFHELPSLKAYYASLLLRNIVATLNSLERWDEALDVLADALQAYPDFTDLHYLQGQIHTSRPRVPRGREELPPGDRPRRPRRRPLPGPGRHGLLLLVARPRRAARDDGRRPRGRALPAQRHPRRPRPLRRARSCG